MTTGEHGGYRKPQRPAAVSTPRSGARTDSGPADKQPIRTPTGGSYGEAKSLTEQQQAAPLAAGAPPSAGGRASPGGAANPASPAGAFGPTQRPNEPISAGSGMDMAGSQGPTVQQILKKVYEAYPSPYIRGLLGDAY